MKIKNLWEKVPFKNYIYVALGINIITLISIFAVKSFLPPEAPLFYGNVAGEAQLVKTALLSIAPMVSLLILFINIFLTSFFEDIFLKRILIVSASFVSLVISITIFKIILLVGLF